jgi:competence protein ComEA
VPLRARALRDLGEVVVGIDELDAAHDRGADTRPAPRAMPPRPSAGRGGRGSHAWSGPGERWLAGALDRLEGWRSDARFGVVLLIVVAVVAGVIWYQVGLGGGADAGGATASSRPSPSAPSPARRSPTSTTAAVSARATTTTVGAGGSKPGAAVVVHVAGAVAHPGVVELAVGSRVIDAVEAVGGALPEADLDRLNLAAKLTDGERVFVPKVGQPDPAGGAPGTAGDATVDGKVDLNTATQAQLETLPGVGPALAQAIIAERQRRGGFKSVNELRSVHGIGDRRFADLKDLVSV